MSLVNTNTGLLTPKARRNAAMSGTVTHPEDLSLAIKTLPEAAKTRLDRELDGSEPTPKAVSEAFDWYREEYGHNSDEELALRAKYLGEANG